MFSALYLEAFIYDYCARKDSQSLAKTLDKLDPPNKWVIGTRLINGKGIDTSKKPYQNLKELFSTSVIVNSVSPSREYTPFENL